LPDEVLKQLKMTDGHAKRNILIQRESIVMDGAISLEAMWKNSSADTYRPSFYL
jgi:hypothetical protein